MPTFFESFLSSLRRRKAPEMPPLPPPAVPQLPIDILWKDTEFGSLVAEIQKECSSWPAGALMHASEAELSAGKAAHMRRAPAKSLHHLLKAMAYRHVAGAPESDEILGNISSQLSENRMHKKAIEVGAYAYQRRQSAGAPPESLGLAAFKLAVYNFYVGDLAQCRSWMNALPDPNRIREFQQFEARLKGCEDVNRELTTAAQASGSFEDLATEVDRLETAGQFVPAAGALACAYLRADHDGRLKEAYTLSTRLGAMLFDKFRYYSASSDWYLRAGAAAQKNCDYEAAYHAFLRSGNARLETGDSSIASQVLRGAWEQIGAHLVWQSQADLLAMLAVAASWTDQHEARRLVQNAALLLKSEQLEDSLRWALKYGARFSASEQHTLALYIVETAYSLLPKGYYSSQVASLIQTKAHIHYMQESWVNCVAALNEARNLSFEHEDWDNVALALIRLSEAYEAANQLALAQRCVQRAFELRNQVSEGISASLGGRMSIIFRPLSRENDSGFSVLMPPILEDVPGTPKFVMTLDAFENIADAVTAELKSADSGGSNSTFLSAAQVFRIYGIGLDRAGDQRKAAQMLWRAYKLQRALQDYPEAAVSLHEYGVAKARANQVIAARRAYYVAMAIKMKYGTINSESANDSFNNFVQASIILGIKDGLAEQLQRLWEKSRSHETSSGYLFDASSPVSLLITVASGYSKLGQHDTAIKIASQIAKELDAGADPSRYLMMSDLATILIDAGRFDEAIERLRITIAGFETNRAQISEPHRTEWQRYVSPAVDRFLEASYARGGALARECLAKVEIIKVRSLLERFGRTRVPAPANLPADTLAKDEDNRRATAESLAEYLATEDSKKEQKYFVYSMHVSDENMLLRSVADAAPEYVKLRRGLPLDPSEIIDGRVINKETQILVLQPAKRFIYIWHMDGRATLLNWRRADVELEELRGTLGLVAESVSKHGWAGDSVAKLSDLLLGDLAHVTPGTDLCIVPGDALIGFPFCACRLSEQYIVERFPLAILPSFSLAGFWSQSRQANTSKSLVLSDSLGDLPNAREEAKSVSTMLKAAQLKGNEVTREATLAGLSEAEVLHVACHASFNSADPLDSGVFLAGKVRLTCRDLIKTNTRGKFAFLSACESNKVAFSSGDELMGLLPSMLYSGFESVLGSLWRVPDRETKDLALDFYRATQKGAPLHHALRDAQMSLLSRSKSSSPYYWAGWQLVGNWQMMFGR
jgi:CHAT domain